MKLPFSLSEFEQALVKARLVHPDAINDSEGFDACITMDGVLLAYEELEKADHVVPGVEELRIKCDEPGCDWSLACGCSGLHYFHNRPCPKCGRGVILNDYDMATLYHALSLAYMSNAVDPKAVMPRVAMSIDAAQARKPTKDGLTDPPAAGSIPRHE